MQRCYQTPGNTRLLSVLLPFVKGGSLTHSDSWWIKHSFEGSASKPTCYLYVGEKGLLFSKYKVQSPAKQFHQGSRGIWTVNNLKATCVRAVISGATASCMAPVSGTTQAARTTLTPASPLDDPSQGPFSLCSERPYHETHCATSQTWQVWGETFS